MGTNFFGPEMFIMVPKWKFKSNSEALGKFLYFDKFDFKNDHFDSLYTVSRWQFFEIRSERLPYFGPKMVKSCFWSQSDHCNDKWKFKENLWNPENSYVFLNWLQKWSFWQSIHCVSITIFGNKVWHGQYFLVLKSLQNCAQMKFESTETALRKFWKFIFCQLWLQKWSFWQSIHCISMTIFVK